MNSWRFMAWSFADSSWSHSCDHSFFPIPTDIKASIFSYLWNLNSFVGMPQLTITEPQFILDSGVKSSETHFWSFHCSSIIPYFLMNVTKFHSLRLIPPWSAITYIQKQIFYPSHNHNYLVFPAPILCMYSPSISHPRPTNIPSVSEDGFKCCFLHKTQ